MFFVGSDTDIAEAVRRSRTEIDEHFQHRTASVPYRRFPRLLEAQILSFQLPGRKSRNCFGLVYVHVCLCGLALFALEKWSSPSVRDDFGEVSFYLIFSLIWIALTQSAFAFLGVSIRDDVAERRNRSAGFAVAGLTIAATCCVAGSNIGDGPGFEVVLFCAVLATGYLLALWFAVAQTSGLADAISIERDLAAGIRVGGWFAGTGAVI